jgi:hypothetical protein
MAFSPFPSRAAGAAPSSARAHLFAATNKKAR